jgi:hypothetical protein
VVTEALGPEPLLNLDEPHTDEELIAHAELWEEWFKRWMKVRYRYRSEIDALFRKHRRWYRVG